MQHVRMCTTEDVHIRVCANEDICNMLGRVPRRIRAVDQDACRS
jgi:hypothetical protein